MEHRSILSKRLDMFKVYLVNNKYDISALIVIITALFYIYTSGPFGSKNYILDVSNAEISCRNPRGDSYYVYMELDGKLFFSGKRFSKCNEVLDKIKGRELIAYYGKSGVVGKLMINGEIFFDESPLIFVFPFSILFFGIYMSAKKTVTKWKSKS